MPCFLLHIGLNLVPPRAFVLRVRGDGGLNLLGTPDVENADEGGVQDADEL